MRRIFEEYAAGRSAKAIAQALNREGIAGPAWRGLGPEHDRRQCRPRHRHPQQRALPRPAGLEPAALRQGPEHRQARVAAQRRRRSGSSSRCPSCGSSTTSCGRRSRRGRPGMTSKVEGVGQGGVLGPAPAALPVLGPDALRGVRRRLRQDQPAPFRLLDRAQQGHLQQPADHPPRRARGDGAGCPAPPADGPGAVRACSWPSSPPSGTGCRRAPGPGWRPSAASSPRSGGGSTG